MTNYIFIYVPCYITVVVKKMTFNKLNTVML